MLIKVSRTLAERRGSAGHERPPGRAAVVSAHAYLPTTIEDRRDLIPCIYVGSVDHEVFMFFGRHRSDKRETKRAAADLTKLLRRCARIRVGGGISAQAHAACAPDDKGLLALSVGSRSLRKRIAQARSPAPLTSGIRPEQARGWDERDARIAIEMEAKDCIPIRAHERSKNESAATVSETRALLACLASVFG